MHTRIGQNTIIFGSAFALIFWLHRFFFSCSLINYFIIRFFILFWNVRKIFFIKDYNRECMSKKRKYKKRNKIGMKLHDKNLGHFIHLIRKNNSKLNHFFVLFYF